MRAILHEHRLLDCSHTDVIQTYTYTQDIYYYYRPYKHQPSNAAKMSIAVSANAEVDVSDTVLRLYPAVQTVSNY